MREFSDAEHDYLEDLKLDHGIAYMMLANTAAGIVHRKGRRNQYVEGMEFGMAAILLEEHGGGISGDKEIEARTHVNELVALRKAASA